MNAKVHFDLDLYGKVKMDMTIGFFIRDFLLEVNTFRKPTLPR